MNGYRQTAMIKSANHFQMSLREESEFILVYLCLSFSKRVAIINYSRCFFKCLTRIIINRKMAQ